MLTIAPGQPSASDATALKAGPNGSGAQPPAPHRAAGTMLFGSIRSDSNIRTYSGAENHAVRTYCP